MNNAQIAERIKKACKDKGITVKQLLENCELSKSLIYDMEKRNVTIGVDKITKIAIKLNCSTDYLLGLSENFKKYA